MEKNNKREQKIEKLAAALSKAKEAALRYINIEDGGTCNFDTAEIFLPRWRETDVERACEKAGLRCYKKTYWAGTCYDIFGYQSGQGDRRSIMAEEFAKVLKTLGYDSSVYYQMD